MGKDCRPSASVRKIRRTKAALSAAPSTTPVEQKLGTIISHLRGGITPSSSGRVAHNVSLEPDDGLVQTHRPFPPLSESSYDLTPRLSEIPPVDADNRLLGFRTLSSKYFPFIDVPASMSAQQILHERPVLWHWIMAMSSRSTTQQSVYYDKVRHILARKMVLDFENNLDTLLALIAYVGW